MREPERGACRTVGRGRVGELAAVQRVGGAEHPPLAQAQQRPLASGAAGDLPQGTKHQQDLCDGCSGCRRGQCAREARVGP